MEDERHLVDAGHRRQGDDSFTRHIAVDGNLLLNILVHVVVGAAYDCVGLYPDSAQFANAVLRRLGLQLTGGRYVGQECEVNIEDIVASHFVTHLSYGFEEWKALDVAHGSTYFYDYDVGL